MNIHANKLRDCADTIAGSYSLDVSDCTAPIIAAAAEIERLEAALAEKEKECQRLREAIDLTLERLAFHTQFALTQADIESMATARAVLGKEGQ